MSGRERTGADFYPPGGGGVRTPFRSQGRPAPKIQASSGEKFFDPFLTLLGGAPKGRPEGVSVHPLTVANFYKPALGAAHIFGPGHSSQPAWAGRSTDAESTP